MGLSPSPAKEQGTIPSAKEINGKKINPITKNAKTIFLINLILTKFSKNKRAKLAY